MMQGLALHRTAPGCGGVAAWLRACKRRRGRAGQRRGAGRRRLDHDDVGMAIGDRHRHEAGDDDERRPGHDQPDHAEAPPGQRAASGRPVRPVRARDAVTWTWRRLSTRDDEGGLLEALGQRPGVAGGSPGCGGASRLKRKRIGCAPGPSVRAVPGGSCTASGTQRASVGVEHDLGAVGEGRALQPLDGDRGSAASPRCRSSAAPGRRSRCGRRRPGGPACRGRGRCRP